MARTLTRQDLQDMCNGQEPARTITRSAGSDTITLHLRGGISIDGTETFIHMLQGALDSKSR